MNLAQLSSQKDLTQLQGKGNNILNSDALSTIWSTLYLLMQSCCHPEKLRFVCPALTVTTHGLIESLIENKLEFLQSLVHSSHEVSERASCSSLLGGQSNESDDFGDVGLVLPMIEGDRETGVLEALGLRHCLHHGGKMTVYDYRNHEAVPSSLLAMRKAKLNLERVEALLLQLQDSFEIRIEGHNSIVICIFLGTLSIGKTQVLAGLLGAGVWSDRD